MIQCKSFNNRQDANGGFHNIRKDWPDSEGALVRTSVGGLRNGSEGQTAAWETGDIPDRHEADGGPIADPEDAAYVYLSAFKSYRRDAGFL